KSKSHFKDAVARLFPAHYLPLSDNLYSNLRCGLLHCSLPRGYSLAELKNYPMSREDHLVSNTQLIVIDFFYSDFVEACRKVVGMTFPPTSKMNNPLLIVG